MSGGKKNNSLELKMTKNKIILYFLFFIFLKLINKTPIYSLLQKRWVSLMLCCTFHMFGRKRRGRRKHLAGCAVTNLREAPVTSEPFVTSERVLKRSETTGTLEMRTLHYTRLFILINSVNVHISWYFLCIFYKEKTSSINNNVRL